jgi:hypothetical protein
MQLRAVDPPHVSLVLSNVSKESPFEAYRAFAVDLRTLLTALKYDKTEPFPASRNCSRPIVD